MFLPSLAPGKPFLHSHPLQRAAHPRISQIPFPIQVQGQEGAKG